MRRLHEFVEVDAVAAHAAIKAFNRHTWYLTEEVVPLCLFSEDVTDDVKAEIAGKLLKLPQSNPLNWHGAGFGKPALPVIEENVREKHSFFGPDSWKFFNLLKLDSTFLSASPTEWDRNESFLSSKRVIKHLSIVNDVAERGVKLASDFLCGTKNETCFQNILQVVENDRNATPNQRKPTKASEN